MVGIEDGNPVQEEARLIRGPTTDVDPVRRLRAREDWPASQRQEYVGLREQGVVPNGREGHPPFRIRASGLILGTPEGGEAPDVDPGHRDGFGAEMDVDSELA